MRTRTSKKWTGGVPQFGGVANPHEIDMRRLFQPIGLTNDQRPVFAYQSPECNLLAAVLECAIHDYRTMASIPGVRAKRVANAAREWLESEEMDWATSFRSICEVLHLSPEAVRKQVLGDRR